MFKKIFSGVVVIYLLSTLNLYGETIKQAVVEVIQTSPELKEKLRNYRAVQQNLNIIESQYYPTIDIEASFGLNRSSGFIDDLNISENDSYSNYKASITLTQNIFNGFGTKNKIDYEESQILVAAYQYLEKSNEITFAMVKSYLDVLRFEELLKIAVKDVQMSEITYKKIENLFESDMITLSEIKKIESTLAHSKSNLVIHLTKARDAKFKYRRIAGRMPNLDSMRKPEHTINIPKSSQNASLYAINHNPSLLVNRYKVKSLQALRKQNRKGFYPTLDLKLTQNYSDNSRENIYDGADDRFQARLVFNYNLYRGGADSANAQKYISLTNREIENGRAIKRKIIEDVDIAWNIYDMTREQLKDLREYASSSKEAFVLYQEEFSKGSRSLLELILVQNDLIQAENSIIAAEYDSLLAKYSILNATGLLFSKIVGNREFTSKVNLFTDNKVDRTLDTDLVKLDVDSDNISDNRDLCDNSVLENNIMPYGCKKIDRFSSRMKKLIEYKKHNKITIPKPIVVVKKQKKVVIPKKKKIIKKKKRRIIKEPEFIESSFIEENSISRKELLEEDSFTDTTDGCFNVPDDYNIDSEGCAISMIVTLSSGFEQLNRAIPQRIRMKIDELSSFMKKNPTLNADIIGYSSRTAVSSYDYNLKISKERAERFKNELIKQGVFSYRLSSSGKGYRNPIADNNTKVGRNMNRRVEIIFSR